MDTLAFPVANNRKQSPYSQLSHLLTKPCSQHRYKSAQRVTILLFTRTLRGKKPIQKLNCVSQITHLAIRFGSGLTFPLLENLNQPFLYFRLLKQNVGKVNSQSSCKGDNKPLPSSQGQVHNFPSSNKKFS